VGFGDGEQAHLGGGASGAGARGFYL